MSARRPLVIGIGQMLREEDAVGRKVVEQFRSIHPDEADVLGVIQLTPELAEAVSRSSAVAIVDARVNRPNEGILVETIAPTADEPTAFSHVASPTEVLAYARGVFGHAPPAALVSVSTEKLDARTDSSAREDQIIRDAVEKIYRWFADHKE